MKNIKHLFSLLLVIFFLSIIFPVQAVSQQSAEVDPSKLVYPPAPKLNIPIPEKFILPNGLKLLLIEDHRLPLIEVSLLARASSYYEPADKIGLASITGSVMRTGGTQKMTGDEIDLKLEILATEIETYIGQDSGVAYMNCLKENFDTSLSIFADIIMTPRFDQEKIDLAKVEEKSMISRRNDQIGQITAREFQRLLWGKDSVKGRMSEYDTINAITQDNLIEFHKKYFVPNDIIIGVVGDFKTKEMKSRMEKAFSSWKSKEVKFPEVEIRRESEPSINYIFKEDTTQSNIRLGYIAPAMQKRNPDYTAVSLMNYILGESFSSRLFVEVRTKKGLAYNVGGNFNFEFDEPGYFIAYCQTKLESTCQAIDTIKEVLEGLKKGDISNDEFTRAKNALLNSFVFNFDRNRKILDQQLELEYYGYPLDFYIKYLDQLEKLTVEDIERVAVKYLDTSKLTILVVGKKDNFDQPLDKYGSVTQIDITIPEPKVAPLPEATAETIAAGKELFNKVIDAYGGAELLKKNTTRIEEYTLTITMPQGELSMEGKTYSIFPAKRRQEIKSMMGSMAMVFDGEKGWMEMGGKVTDLPDDEIADAKKEIRRELRWISNNADKLTIYTAGEDAVEGKPAAKLIIKEGEDHICTFSIDKETNLIVKNAYLGKDAMTRAPAQQELFLYDFKSIDGITVPHKIIIKQDGKQVMEFKIKKVELNVPISEEFFKKKETGQ